MRNHQTIGFAFLALVLAPAALADSVSYTAIPASAALVHSSGGVTVTADNNGPAQLLLFNPPNGVGVLGGNTNVELNEYLTFDFEGFLAENVVLDIKPQIPMGPMLSVAGFGIGGKPLGEFHAASFDLVLISLLFGNEPLTKFRVTTGSGSQFDNFAVEGLTWDHGDDEADEFQIGQTLRGFVSGFSDARSVAFEGQAGARIKLTGTSDETTARVRIQLVTPALEEETSAVMQLGATADEVSLPMELDGTYLLRIESMSDDAGEFAIATAIDVDDVSPSAVLKGKKGALTQDLKFKAVAGSTLSGTLIPNGKVKKHVTAQLLDPNGVAVDLTGASALLAPHGLQLTNVPIATTGEFMLRVAGLSTTKMKLSASLVMTLPDGAAGDAILP